MQLLHLFRYFVTHLLLFYAVATEKQCHDDCRAVPSRLVGPTRPSDEMDALGNPIHRPTRSYPHHVASTEEYDFPRFCEMGCTLFFISSAGVRRSLWPRARATNLASIGAWINVNAMILIATKRNCRLQIRKLLTMMDE